MQLWKTTHKWRISRTDDPEWWEAGCAEAAVGGEHLKECRAVPRAREERAALQCLFGNLTQLTTFLSFCETGHLSLLGLRRFFFRKVFWGTPAVLVISSWTRVGSSVQSKTNTNLTLSLSLSLSLWTQQRSECGRSPGASAPTTTLLCHALLLPTIALILFQPMFSQTGRFFHSAVTFRTHSWLKG